MSLTALDRLFEHCKADAVLASRLNSFQDIPLDQWAVTVEALGRETAHPVPRDEVNAFVAAFAAAEEAFTRNGELSDEELELVSGGSACESCSFCCPPTGTKPKAGCSNCHCNPIGQC